MISCVQKLIENPFYGSAKERDRSEFFSAKKNIQPSVRNKKSSDRWDDGSPQPSSESVPVLIIVGSAKFQQIGTVLIVNQSDSIISQSFVR